MNTKSPFAYPAAAHTRRHGPRGYKDCESYRPWIRDEFAFRCVYCLFREVWGPFKGAYALDHFLPIAHHPHLALEYDNLLYACMTCNLSKGGLDTPQPLDTLFDPQEIVLEDGTVRASSATAQRLIELLGLNRPRLCEFRELWLRIIRLAEVHPDLYKRLRGFPPDLPDLLPLRPPEGNTRVDGIAQSHFARRQRNELPDLY